MNKTFLKVASLGLVAIGAMIYNSTNNNKNNKDYKDYKDYERSE